MARQLVVYNGTVVVSDSANTAGAVVERDGNGNVACAGITASTFLETLGALFLFGKSYTTTVTLDETATVVQLNASGGAFTATLPAAATVQYQVYILMKSDTSGNLPTVKGNGSELINAANTYTGLAAQYNVVALWSDGTKW